MIKSFEPVYKELEELFIHKLPDYIEKSNKEHNDGIILKRFENQTLEEECIKLPCFKFTIEESEFSEKDRIIENSVFTVSFEIKLPQFYKNQIIVMWRYIEAIQKMLFEENWELIILKVQGTKVRFKIILN